MNRFAPPVLAAILAIGLTSAPARADDASDVVAASAGLVKDAHAVSGLLLESLGTLESFAGDAETRAQVAKAIEQFKKSKPDDLSAVKAFGPQLETITASLKKNGLKPKALTGADAESLKTALVKVMAAGMIASGEASRASELGQKAAGLIMANPFGAMAFKPAADNAALVGGLVPAQAAAVQQAVDGLKKFASESNVAMPSGDDVQALVRQLAPAAGIGNP